MEIEQQLSLIFSEIAYDGPAQAGLFILTRVNAFPASAGKSHADTWACLMTFRIARAE